jgi:hypothetical protein
MTWCTLRLALAFSFFNRAWDTSENVGARVSLLDFNRRVVSAAHKLAVSYLETFADGHCQRT